MADVEREEVMEENRRWTLLRQVDIQGQLGQILGEGAAFGGVDSCGGTAGVVAEQYQGPV